MEKGNRRWRYQFDDGQEVTLQAQGLSSRWPKGGFTWKRPIYVHIEGPSGEQAVPGIDMTRILTMGLYVMSAVVLFVSFFRRGTKSRA